MTLSRGSGFAVDYNVRWKMKKIIFVCMFFFAIAFCGCTPTEEELESRVAELQSEIELLQQEKESLENEIVDIKVEKGTAVYVVTLSIKQKHHSFDISEHLKDEMNEIFLSIPVTEEYYNSVEVGDSLSEEFRAGSFLFKGSFGSWKITIEEKQIV